jgi:hypothetical protein
MAIKPDSNVIMHVPYKPLSYTCIELTQSRIHMDPVLKTELCSRTCKARRKLARFVAETFFSSYATEATGPEGQGL